jgi:hypothetical protein
MVTRKIVSKRRAHALKNGYRSGLEEEIADTLRAKGVNFTYEKTKIKYIQPASEHQYTADFELENGIIIESKGRFLVADRKKHLLIKRQQPHLDIRFVFSNSKQKLNKGSRTSYADWCNKNGFLYSDKTIPEDWIKERRKKVSDGTYINERKS